MTETDRQTDVAYTGKEGLHGDTHTHTDGHDGEKQTEVQYMYGFHNNFTFDLLKKLCITNEAQMVQMND